ncbi:MAG: DUF4358 domain-containing protein [Oscillospiraceae bacterium]
MNKKIVSLGLATAMAVSLAVPALAYAEIMPISAPISNSETAPARYAYTIAVNGTPLDLVRLPAGEGLPLRAVAEADFGAADWYPDENISQFYFGSQNSVRVNYLDNTITVNDKAAEGKAVVIDGVTFVPATVLAMLDGNYKVALDEAAAAYTITSRNGEPMMKLARDISTELDMGNLGYTTPADLEEYHGIKAENFTEVAAFFPMMISANSVVVGKLAEGKEAAAKEQFEAYRKQQEKSFEHYMMQNLPAVKAAECVVKDGYILFVIGGQYKDPDFEDPNFPANPKTAKDAVKVFEDFVAAQKAAV